MARKIRPRQLSFPVRMALGAAPPASTVPVAPAPHIHVIADITSLQGSLDSKQPLALILTNTTASFTTAQETKLSGIAAGATVNSSDAFLLSRANHTGTQAVGTITGLGTLATQNGTFSGSSSGTNTGDQTSVSGNAGTASALLTGHTIGMTGDLVWATLAFDGTANITAVGTLATVNTNVGTFGSSTLIPVITANAKGLITAISTVVASGGGGLGGVATITVPNSRYEHTETVSATGVTGTSQVILGLAPALDTEENCAELLDIVSFVAEPDVNVITITITFSMLSSGPVKFNWSSS